MAFSDIDNFAIEFAFRTQLNYYQLLKLENQSRGFDNNDIDRKIHSVQEQMIERGFNPLEPQNLCCGTQLMNSVLGFLVFPQQQLFNRIPEDFQWRLLPILARCVGSREFVNDYILISNNHHEFHNEEITPKNVLRHLKNSISHKRVMFYPTVTPDSDNTQVSRLVFEDEKIIKLKDNNEWLFDVLEDRVTYDERGKKQIVQRFHLTINREDFDEFLMEIMRFFVSLDN